MRGDNDMTTGFLGCCWLEINMGLTDGLGPEKVFNELKTKQILFIIKLILI